MVIPADATEAAILDAVVARVDDPAFVEHVEARAARMADEEHEVAALLADAVMGTPGAAGADGLWNGNRQIDDEAWRRLRQRVEDRVRVSGSELADQALLARQRKLCRAGATLRSDWDDLDFEERRAAIEAVVDHVVVVAARGRPGPSTADRLRIAWRS